MARPDIEGIRERESAAHKGPWLWEDWGRCPDGSGYEHMVLSSPPPDVPDRMFPNLRTPLFELYDSDDVNDEDMDFIAHAREDVPTLLAYIAELETVSKLFCEALSRDDDSWTTSETEESEQTSAT